MHGMSACCCSSVLDSRAEKRSSTQEPRWVFKDCGFKDLAASLQSQSLQWVYGLSNVTSNIVNLSDEHNERVCYAAAHTAVIYDKRTKKQTFLQVGSVSVVVGLEIK